MEPSCIYRRGAFTLFLGKSNALCIYRRGAFPPSLGKWRLLSFTVRGAFTPSSVNEDQFDLPQEYFYPFPR